MSEQPFSVGPGVQQLMDEHADVPRSDETYLVEDEGYKISETFGRDAIYYWLQEDNAVHRVLFR
jgi:hypothetical protein